MSANNTFHLPRFFKLAQQNLIHNQRLIALALVGFSGGLFFLFFLIQLSNNLQQGTQPDIFLPAFLAIFMGSGALFCGNAFPSFRSKEKTFGYLMLPASTFEKYLLEILTRLAALFLVLPALFWLIFHFEGFVFQLFYSDASFEMLDLSRLAEFGPDEELPGSFKLLVAGLTVMGLLIALTGSAHFERFPLVKTMFAVAVLFFASMGILYVIIEHLGLGKYRPNERMILIPNSGKQGALLFTIAFWIIDIVLAITIYLKLKEKEV